MLLVGAAIAVPAAVAGAAAATGAVLQAAGRRGLLVRQEVSHTSFPATPMVC
jgi:hypothetical protein